MKTSSIFMAMAVLFGSVFKDKKMDFTPTRDNIRGGAGYLSKGGKHKSYAGKPGQRAFTGEQGENRLYPDTSEGRALKEDRRKDRNIAKRMRQKAA